MDWTCPRCGGRIYQYDGMRIQNRCRSCGYRVDDTLARAGDHLRAGNWNQAVSLLLSLTREQPADVRLHQLILRAATKEFRDYEMNDSDLRTAASDAWNRLIRLNGLTGEMLCYSRACYENRMEKLTAIRNKFLRRILIASVLFFRLGSVWYSDQPGPPLLLTGCIIWTLYRAMKLHPFGAIRALRMPAPAWSANPFLWRMP